MQESLRKRMESAERLIQEQANRAEELQSGLKDLSGALSRNSETLGAKIKKLVNDPSHFIQPFCLLRHKSP